LRVPRLGSFLVLSAGLFELAIARGVNLGSAALEHRLRGDVAKRTVRPSLIVDFDIRGDQMLAALQ
jgi:hypothetical protein